MYLCSCGLPFSHKIYSSGSAYFHRPCSGAIIKPTLKYRIGKELINGRIRLLGDELMLARFFPAIERDINSGKNILLYSENGPNFRATDFAGRL